MEVKINKDILQQQDEVAFGLSTRQVVLIVIGIVGGAALAAVTGLFRDIAAGQASTRDIRTFLPVIVAVPFGLCAFVQRDGLKAEQWFSAWVRWWLLAVRRLTYRSEIFYCKRKGENQYGHFSLKIQKKTR